MAITTQMKNNINFVSCDIILNTHMLIDQTQRILLYIKYPNYRTLLTDFILISDNNMSKPIYLYVPQKLSLSAMNFGYAKYFAMAFSVRTGAQVL